MFSSPKNIALLAMLVVALAGAGLWASGIFSSPQAIMEKKAQAYVVLALSLDQQKEGEVDSYFGPSEFLKEAQGNASTVEELLADAIGLASSINESTAPETEVRARHLLEKVEQLITVIELILAPDKLPFREETDTLYGLSLPEKILSYQEKLDELESLLPGRGTLAFKLASYNNKLVIPADKREAVFEAALAACRERTLTYWDLPADESLSIEWTRDVQAAWHQYEGANKSTLRINGLTVGLVSGAVDLACHEGYPGHHAQFVLMDNADNVQGLPIEDSLVLLRSPGSVLREGAANAGIDLVFPFAERLTFERDVLFPIAGLSASEAETNLRIHTLVNELSSAVVPIIEEYYNGDIIFNAASFRLEREAMISSPIALLEFVDEYGTYSMGYTVARDMINTHLNTLPDSQRWQALANLITQPASISMQEVQNEE